MTSEIKLVEGKFGGSGTLEEPSGDLATRGSDGSRRAEIEAHEQAVEQVRMRYYQLYKGFGAAFWAVLFVFCNYITIYYSFGTVLEPKGYEYIGDRFVRGFCYRYTTVIL
eukprot:1395177-Amorphochlora_amoeboformis.AAC.2